MCANETPNFAPSAAKPISRTRIRWNTHAVPLANARQYAEMASSLSVKRLLLLAIWHGLPNWFFAYTEEQAERIFENVKDFMQKLSKRISEATE